ncbi:phage tail family protein [Enterococcus avium]|uniref:distal tail protein Dit n=1 Tax=Enterococcus avium TaxID=33945 RepID=UPI0017C606D8|nr:distal tail protein Dit [Enterococcus avium]NVN79438.1 phage tail family protein [Enterococcus avium]
MPKTKAILRFSDYDYVLTDDPAITLATVTIGMPVQKNEFVSFQGSVGQRLVNHSFDSFPITLEFDLKVRTLDDLVLKETELRELLTREAEYYFIYSKEPGKKYPVVVESMAVTRKAFFMSRFTVSYTVAKGYAESITSTLSDFSLDDEWQFSQGILSEDYKYTHNTSRFSIYNAGSFPLDPRQAYLKITLQGESGGNANIFNRTTGDRFIYYPAFSTNLGQTITLDRVCPKLNGVSRGIDTNHGLITLAEGLNEIEIQNVSNVETSWDFYYLYK